MGCNEDQSDRTAHSAKRRKSELLLSESLEIIPMRLHRSRSRFIRRWPLVTQRAWVSSAGRTTGPLTSCGANKKRDKKCGLLPPEPTPEVVPWRALCIDLVRPRTLGNKDKPKMHTELCCMTMTDPPTGFFEAVEIGKKAASAVAHWSEIHWLSQHP